MCVEKWTKQLLRSKFCGNNFIRWAWQWQMQVEWRIGWKEMYGSEVSERTADISEFQNFEYKNNESRIIRIFYVWIYFLIVRFFKLFKHSKNIYDDLLILFLEFLWFYRFLKFGNLIIFSLEQFQKFLEFYNLEN